jgi:VRR-NUC domain
VSESDLMRLIMREATPYARLFRNNVGRLEWQPGKWLNYGLCVGSGDLIGWTPRLIAGQQVAVFTSIEVKSERGRLTEEQENFGRVVTEAGGISVVARSVEEALSALTKPTT